MHDRIPFFLALRSTVRRFQMPFEGLSFVRTLVKLELFTQQTHFYKIRLSSFASVDSPSIFLTINHCRPCWITCANLSKSGQFSTRFISETKTVTSYVFCISGTSNSLSDCSKNFKKIYRVENFRANVLNYANVLHGIRVNQMHQLSRLFALSTCFVSVL